MLLLPMQVRDDFRRLSGHASPVAGLHCVTVHGEARTETYLLTDGRRLFVFERARKAQFRAWHVPLAEVELRLEEAAGGVTLHLSAGETARQLPVAEALRADAERLTSLAGAGVGASVPAPAVAVGDAGARPLVGFCAAMHAMIRVDGDADPGEVSALERVARDPAAVRDGLAHLERVGVDRLIVALAARFDDAQKRCLMANLLEVAMADGVLRSVEQRLLHRFRDGLPVPGDVFQALHDALLTKNRTAIFR